MNRYPSQRRILLTAGSNRHLRSTPNSSSNSLDGSGKNQARTSLVDVLSHEERTNRIRHLVVGFLGGRLLSDEEEDVLQQDCAAMLLLSPDEEVEVDDQQVARRVVNSLLTAYFFMPEPEPHHQHQHQPLIHPHHTDTLPTTTTTTTTASLSDRTSAGGRQLDAEAAQVEAMAVLKLQSFVRGILCRCRVKISKKKPFSVQRLLSHNSQAQAANLTVVLDQVDVTAAVTLQAFMRGYLVRQEIVRQKQEQKEHSSNLATALHTTETISSKSPPKKIPISEIPPLLEEPIPPPPPLIQRESQTLTAISEDEEEVASPTLSHHHQLLNDTNNLTSASTSSTITPTELPVTSKLPPVTVAKGRRQSLLGMEYLKESQKELSSVTATVKRVILVKLQALVRGFLVRRRRRRLLKAQSIRALQLRPPNRIRQWQTHPPTPQEEDAAITLQRTVRGYLQRWHYWTAMREEQLRDIHTLKAKQLRKIKERTKSVLKNCKTQIFFDAASLARQLQRAKRAIKFLVKEERRLIQQNDKLAGEMQDLTKTNQLLSNATETAQQSVQTLQDEIAQLQRRNQSLQTQNQKYTQTLKGITMEWKQVNKDTTDIKQKNQKLQSCIAAVRERARDFLQQEHPDLLGSTCSTTTTTTTMDGDLATKPSKAPPSSNSRSNSPSPNLDCRSESNAAKLPQSQVTA